MARGPSPVLAAVAALCTLAVLVNLSPSLSGLSFWPAGGGGLDLASLQAVLEAPPAQGCTAAGRCFDQILLLGFHNTRTSFSSRLINLMGAWAGPREILDIGANNPLKWWSRHDVLVLHERLLKKYANHSRVPHWAGEGFYTDLLTPADKAAFQKNASQVIEEMNTQRPWVMKDNRFGYTAPLWLELLDRPLCVLTYRHPALTAVRLSQHPGKGKAYNLTAEWYLQNWSEYTERALAICSALPTVLLPTDLAEPATLGVFYSLLDAQLRAAGAAGALRVPSPEDLHAGFVQHWRAEDNRTNRSASLARMSAAEQAMQAGCKRSLDLQAIALATGAAQAGTGSGGSSSAGADPQRQQGGQQQQQQQQRLGVQQPADARGAGVALNVAPPPLWPEGCAVHATPRTLALVRALDTVTHALLTTGKVVKPAALSREVLRLAGVSGRGAGGRSMLGAEGGTQLMYGVAMGGWAAFGLCLLLPVRYLWTKRAAWRGRK